MTTATVAGRVTYGNLRRPRKPGLLGLGMAATVLLGGGFVIAVLVLMAVGLVAALITAVVVAVATAPLVYGGREGRTGYERLAGVIMFRLAERKGRTTYVTGPAGMTPDGRCRLPGLAAASELVQARDVYGQPFGVLVHPASGQYTVIARVRPTGDELADQDVIDAQVAQWGGWLAHLGKEPGFLGASVTVETSPDPGTALVRMLDRHVDHEAAPPFAAQTAAEIAADYPATGGSTATRIALTYSTATGIGQQKRSREEMLDYLARHAPYLVDALRPAGGMAGQLLTASDICDYTRVAFDPAVARLVEEQRGQPGGTGLSWDDAGPSVAVDERDCYRHDGAVSVSWQMREPPAGTFYETTLKPLLTADDDIARKRVTLLYRPVPAEYTAELSRSDVNAARTRATGRQRITQRDRAAVAAAEQAEAEEARGAGMVQVGMVVSATVTDDTRLEQARAAVEKLSRRSRLGLRPARYTQAVAFAAGMPLGLVLPEHTLLPRVLREAL